jgi:hypothetical protein
MLTRSLLIALSIWATVFAAPASARPVTVYFTGEVLFVVDLTTQTRLPSAVGTPFSGYLTYDVADPEYYENILNEYGQPFVRASADSGCNLIQNGVCQGDKGVNAPIITDYRVTWGASTYVPFGNSFRFNDGTQRYNQSVGGTPSGEVWAAARNQHRTEMTGDPNGAYEYTAVQRVVTIQPYTGSVVRALLKKPASNLEQGFNLDVVPAGQSNFFLRDIVSRGSCVASAECPEQVDLGSIQLQGTLKSVSFKGGKAR